MEEYKSEFDKYTITSQELIEACESFERNNSNSNDNDDEVFHENISIEELLAIVDEAETQFIQNNRPVVAFDTSIPTQELLSIVEEAEKSYSEQVLAELLLEVNAEPENIR